MRKSTVQMLVVMIVACLLTQIPLFVLASDIDEDEWRKFGTSVVIMTIGAVAFITRECVKWFLSEQRKQSSRSHKVFGVPIIDDTLREQEFLEEPIEDSE